MQTAVTSVSALVRPGAPAPRSGRVHSTFATSLNVELDGSLVHLGPDTAPLSCFGATVQADEMADLVARSRVGDEARLSHGVLRIYSRARVSELALGAAPVRDLAVGAAARVPEGADAALVAVLERMGLIERIGLPWPDRSRAAVTDLARFSVACLRAEEGSGDDARYEAAVRAMRGAVDYLLGRGLGLTPSGDDVLTGFGCGLRFLHGAQGWADPFFAAVLEALPGRTTAVSEAYLRAMCAGYANEDYLDLLAAIGAGRFEDLSRLCSRILSIGHTSGADTLLGFGASFSCLLS